jgi:hypothetical protein
VCKWEVVTPLRLQSVQTGTQRRPEPSCTTTTGANVAHARCHYEPSGANLRTRPCTSCTTGFTPHFSSQPHSNSFRSPCSSHSLFCAFKRGCLYCTHQTWRYCVQLHSNTRLDTLEKIRNFRSPLCHAAKVVYITDGKLLPTSF